MIKFTLLEWSNCQNGIRASAFGIEGFYIISGRPENWTLKLPGKNSFEYREGLTTQFSAKCAAQKDFNDRVGASIIAEAIKQ